MGRRPSDDKTRKRDVDGGRSGRSGAELLDREPPINPEAEINVIGSILLMPDVADDVVSILRPDDFWDEANAILYRQMHDMRAEGLKIDITLLRERLKQSGEYETIGGAAYLGKVINSVTTAAHAEHYAHIVQEKSTLRRLAIAATEIVRDVYEGDGPVKARLSAAEQRVFAVLDDRQGNTIRSMDDLLNEELERIDARMRGEHLSNAVDTGFTDLDAMTGGLHASELVILAARPSMGKTAFAMNIAEHVVLKANEPVLFVSLEMSAIELIERMLCSVSKVNGHRLHNGTISQEDRRKLVEKIGAMSKAPLHIDDAPSRTVSEIAAAARRIKSRQKRLGLIVIDYLQLIEPDNPKDPRQEQVAKIARRLKGLAREIEVPVLCLAQLNRQAEDSRDHRPRLSHLRESGAIEQDADVVMFVHREEYYLRGEAQKEVAGQAMILIEKQRAGPTGDVKLTWMKDFTRFENANKGYEELDDYRSETIESV